MRRILKPLLVVLPYLWYGTQCLVRYLGDADFIIQRTQDPAWFGAMIEYLVKPAPAFVQLAVFAFGGLMLYLLYIRNKPTRVVQTARQTDSTIDDFKKYARQYTEHICELVNLYPINPTIVEIFGHPQELRVSKAQGKIDELENVFEETMEHLEMLANRCKIRRFFLRLENPTEYIKPYGPTIEINSFNTAMTWVTRWCDFKDIEDKKKLKDKVREAANEQEKEYLEKYAHKLTQERYEATNS